MERRTFLKSAGMLGMAAWMTSCTSRPASNKNISNIIYILADDLGYGDLSCFGQTEFATPNIDLLADEGMKFTQHYSGSTVCAPSRCSLMTGLHTGHTQVRGNREIQPEGQAPMLPGTVTIPTLLKKARYVSGAFGKWGLGYPGSDSDPTEYFDEFFGYNCQRIAHRYYPAYLWHNKEKYPLAGNDWTNKKTFAGDVIQEKALDFIRRNNSNKTGKPFFLYYPTTIPHAELIAPDDEISRQFIGKFDERYYPGGNTDTPNQAKYGPELVIEGYCPQEHPKAMFASLVTRLDRYVGEILDVLKQEGLDEQTLVIFTSDNGPHEEGGIHPDDFNSNGDLRGMKRDLYEGGIRVPMLARWPKHVQAETVSTHISAFWDMLPTFCEIAQVAAPEDTDGISMLPVLLGKTQPQHDYLYWEFPAKGGRQAVRMGDFKAVRLDVQGNPDAEIELYDLQSDIGEQHNIADKHAKIVAKAASLFKKARVDSETFPLFS